MPWNKIWVLWYFFQMPSFSVLKVIEKIWNVLFCEPSWMFVFFPFLLTRWSLIQFLWLPVSYGFGYGSSSLRLFNPDYSQPSISYNNAHRYSKRIITSRCRKHQSKNIIVGIIGLDNCVNVQSKCRNSDKIQWKSFQETQKILV